MKFLKKILNTNLFGKKNLNKKTKELIMADRKEVNQKGGRKALAEH